MSATTSTVSIYIPLLAWVCVFLLACQEKRAYPYQVPDTARTLSEIRSIASGLYMAINEAVSVPGLGSPGTTPLRRDSYEFLTINEYYYPVDPAILVVREHLIVDHWGESVKVKITKNGAAEAGNVVVEVWSSGPNRLDELGAGDDLYHRFPAR